MTRDWVIERLRAYRPSLRASTGHSDFALHPAGRPPESLGRGLREAGVLVPLVNRPEGVTILLTQRTDHLAQHAGQVAFPGGRREPSDPHLRETALRETEEEIGLPRHHVEVIGELDVYETNSAYAITPVVGWIEPPFPLIVDPVEVADVFEVPLAFILDPVNHRRESRLRDGIERRYYVLPYDGRYIWGATAGMLVNLAGILGRPILGGR
ncbi:MAG: CoA pyrophosphatase [Alphaproteobacteria bacterium]|nr:CoA pyrophosphatase [Alphaproteobacteria bacterium]